MKLIYIISVFGAVGVGMLLGGIAFLLTSDGDPV